MKFKLEIEMDNDAFVGINRYTELKRLLKNAWRSFTNSPCAKEAGGKLRDINGNTVGSWSVEED